MDEQPPGIEGAKLAFEQEKWLAEQGRLDQKDADQKRENERNFALHEREVTLREVEAKRSRWSNPLALAIFAAAIAAIGNAIVSSVNNDANVKLEKFKAESARILEVVKTGDPNKSALNLKFLLDSKLIETTGVAVGIRDYLSKPRNEGEGFSLPSSDAAYSECRSDLNIARLEFSLVETPFLAGSPGAVTAPEYHELNDKLQALANGICSRNKISMFRLDMNKIMRAHLRSQLFTEPKAVIPSEAGNPQ